LVETTTQFSILDDAPVAICYVQDSEIILLGDERHGIGMSDDTHKYLHETIGAVWESGLGLYSNALTSGTPNVNGTNTLVYMDGGVFHDEDLEHEITNSLSSGLMYQNLGSGYTFTTNPSKLPILYKSGSTTTNWYKQDATDFVFPYSANNRPQYNQSVGGVYQLTEVTEDNFFIVWILATNDIYDPVIAIPDISQYSSLSAAQQNSNIASVLTNFPAAEMKLLYRLI
jgi:hypothetical protein